MRVLFFVEPLVMHNRPFHYWAWLGYFARIWRALETPARGHEMRVIVNEALALRAIGPRVPNVPRVEACHGLPPEQVVTLGQEEIRRIFEAPNSEIVAGLHRQTWTIDQTSRYAETVRMRLGGFVPDLVLSLTPADFLRAAFPDAVFLATENGMVSRAPYTGTTFFDPCGSWERSLPALHADTLLERTPAPLERELLARFRAHFAPILEATTPFADLERMLRERYERIAFLPLQFAGEPGFDVNGPFRNQGEFLFHVLERLPQEIALVAVEHPTAIWLGDMIDAETRAYLEARHPRLTLVDFRTVEAAGQHWVRHADYVIALSSSLGLHALLWEKPLISIGTSHLARFAAVQGVENVDPTRPPLPLPGADAALGWLMTHYWVPFDLAFDGAWLDPFLTRSVERARDGKLGLEFYDPVAPSDILEGALCPATFVRPARKTPLAGLLVNGDFARWSAGPGPFEASGETSDGWHLIAAGGTDARVVRAPGRASANGAAAVRIERSTPGDGPTLLLQRVPDVSACANRTVQLRFWARSSTRSALETYFYQQFDRRGVAGNGTYAQRFELAPEWQRCVYSARIPALPNVGRGKRHHTEVAFALPAEPGEACVEVAEVELGEMAVVT